MVKNRCFTLAGGKCIRGQEVKKARGQGAKCKGGFTLAEVLITLVIVGVVAAMTIPSLMVQLDKIVKNNQIKVFERKIEQGMDRMNLAGEIGPYYDTTEKFVQKLSEHMKIVTICDKDNLTNCFPYDEIQISEENKPLKVKDIADGGNFTLNKTDFVDVAGIVLADGTPMILSWNVNCPVSDPDSSSRKGSILGGETPFTASACIKGIYDLNGPKGPNLFTKDVISYGGVTLKKGGTRIAGLNITKVLPAGSWQPMLKSEICSGNTIGSVTFNQKGTEVTTSTIKADTTEALALGIKSCWNTNDYWAGAVRECGGVDHMPTPAHLAQLAQALYKKLNSSNSTPTLGAYQYVDIVSYQNSSEAGQFLASYGLDATSSRFYIWSVEEYNAWGAYARYFFSDRTGYNNDNRDITNYSALCLE